MSKQFTIILKNEDLTETDIYMAIRKYVDDLFIDGEISEYLEFEVNSMD